MEPEPKNKKLANAKALYLEGIRDGHVRTAVEAYTGDRYTQHSTGVKDGVEGFVEFFEPFIARNPVRDIRVLRSIVDGNFVFLHVMQNINNGEARWITTDLFDTDENDKIVEHWDVISAFSSNTQIDGTTSMSDLEKTDANKALVNAFIDDILIRRKVDKLDQYLSAHTCIQHSSTFPDGRDQNTDYKRVFKVIGQGNLVMAYSLVHRGKADMAVFDLFRVDGGKIVEHWDNQEPIPEGPQPNSGKF